MNTNQNQQPSQQQDQAVQNADNIENINSAEISSTRETPNGEATNININDENNNDVADDISTEDFLQQIRELELQLLSKNEENAKLKDGFLRARAEVENVHRRAEEENLKAKKFAVERFANDLLATKDSLEAALNAKEQTIENFHNGVDLILKQLNAAFEKNHLLEVNPINQEKFDPNYYQAIRMIPNAEVPKDCVISVLQKGYLISDRILRPAMVIVSAGNPTPPETNQDQVQEQEQNQNNQNNQENQN